MTDENIDNNLLLDFESFLESGIELSSAQIDRAVELSDRIINPERQWRTYLNSLALLGFETWIEERDSSLRLDSDNCSVKYPSYASYIDGVFNLTVGKHKICLSTNGAAIDEFVSIDRALIDLPGYVAHFYVLVDVIEEQAEVKVDRFISHEEIIERQQTANLIANADWTYEIPLAWFNSQPDDLLLCLRCLEPSIITLPAVTIDSNIQSRLESLLPQLQSGSALERTLTWSQAAAILSDRNLLNWLYELQTTQSSQSVADSLVTLRSMLSSTVTGITQTAVNVKAWLSDELDELAQELSWTLLPTPTASNGLRDLEAISRESPVQEFAAVITQLRGSGEEIPEDARGAYRDFKIDSHGLRLFAVTRDVAELEDVPEWSLLLILGAQPNNYLPQGLKLEVKADNTVLDNKIVAENTDDSYIYTEVIGELNEQFSVSVILADGTAFTFPNFVFNQID